jgi:hypothetical protein
MSRALPCVLKVALMWLLTLAVPVQGFAAASMFNCGPGHHGTAQAQAQMHEAHAAHATHDHGDDGVAPDRPHAHADAPADADAAPVVHKGSCSACASCCMGAALPVSDLGFDALPVHDVIVPLAPPRIAAFLTGGTERPPRPSLA